MKKIILVLAFCLAVTFAYAETYLIEDIQFREIGDDSFEVNFIYDSRNLTTERILRTASKPEIRDEVIRTLKVWLDKRAQENYDLLVDEYEGKDINVTID